MADQSKLERSVPRERGFALLIVLWALVLLSLLGTQLIVSGRDQDRLADRVRESAMVEAAADGAIHQTLFHLLAARDQRWRAGETHRLMVGRAEVEVTIVSLAGRVNPNTASPELLRELLTVLGVEQSQAASLAEAIAEWRTPAGSAAEQDRRASRYRADGRDYRPPGLVFTNIDEVGAVLGVTPQLLDQLRPHLTLWWENDPDPTVADPVVLTAMRALGDVRPRMPGAEGPVQAVSIVATATGSDGAQYVRHADATLNPGNLRMRWRILSWDQRGR